MDKNHFLIRKLSVDDLDQYDRLLRYAFQVTEGALQESGWEDEDIRQSKFPILARASVLGCFDGESLVSQFAVYPVKMNIHSVIYPVGFVTSVTTYPEYAGMGLMSRLMKQSLTDMRERGRTLALLYPYSIPLYRKRGWEIISDKMSYRIRDVQLPRHVDAPGYVRRVPEESPDLMHLHARFAQQTHGCLFRNRLAWDEYWRWENDDMIVALYYNEEHKPLGYLVYYIANEIFHIKEMVYLTSEARHGLWNYISAHFSMITQVRGDNYSGEPMAYLFEDSEIEETIAPYIMARIVDVENFLQEYPWQIQPEDFKIHFRVTDGLASWNQGDFLVSWHEGETTCERVEDNQSINVVELDINTLTALMMGYKRPTYLYDHEKISMEYYMLTWLERLIPVKKPYFSDYF